MTLRSYDNATREIVTREMKQQAVYISPNELADRWRVARATVDRIARRESFKRLCLGEGKNSAIRYLLEDVKDFEERVKV